MFERKFKSSTQDLEKFQKKNKLLSDYFLEFISKDGWLPAALRGICKTKP